MRLRILATWQVARILRKGLPPAGPQGSAWAEEVSQSVQHVPQIVSQKCPKVPPQSVPKVPKQYPKSAPQIVQKCTKKCTFFNLQVT